MMTEKGRRREINFISSEAETHSICVCSARILMVNLEKIIFCVFIHINLYDRQIGDDTERRESVTGQTKLNCVGDMLTRTLCWRAGWNWVLSNINCSYVISDDDDDSATFRPRSHLARAHLGRILPYLIDPRWRRETVVKRKMLNWSASEQIFDFANFCIFRVPGVIVVVVDVF